MKPQLSILRTFLMAIGLMLFFQLTGFGQAVGDYRSNRSGNWSALNTWQRLNALPNTWAQPTAGQGYPGQYASPGNVEIRDNHTVSVDVSPANSIGSITINGGGNDSYITFPGTESLVVTGDIYLNSNSNNDQKAIYLDAGTLTAGSVTMNATNDDRRDAYIRISTGTVTVAGDITMNSTGMRNYILFTDAGLLNVGGTITGGNITSTVNGSANAPTTGTVNYNSGGQTVGAYNYYNLTLSGSGAKTLQTGTTNIGGNLTLTGAATTQTVAGLTVGGDLIIEDGTTFSAGANNQLIVSGATTIGSGASGVFNISAYNSSPIFNGPVTINLGGTWNNSASAPVIFRGGLSNYGTFNPGSTYTYTFDTNSQSINGTVDMGGSTVVITGVNVTNNGSLTFSTNFNGSGTLTNAAAGSLNIGGSTYTNITTLNNQGTLNLTSTGGVGTATANFTNTGTINLNGSAYVTGLTNNAGGVVNLINASQSIGTLNNATSTSVLNISTLATTAINTLTATVAGNTVNYNGVGNQTIKNTTYSNLILSGSGDKTLEGTTTVNGTLTLDGATLRSGATTGNPITGGTLDVASNSTIALGTGSHNLNFANSSAETWNGTTLTITGWTGTEGSSGTAGKIFVGTDNSGLLSTQLDKISFSGYSAGAQILSTGEIVPLSTLPFITVSPVSLSFGTVPYGSISAEQTYTLNGYNLTGFPGNITIVAPSGFEVSQTSGTGFSSSINVAYSSATLSATTIFVRFHPTASNTTYSGNISNSGGSATPQNVSVSGNSILSYCAATAGGNTGITSAVFNTINRTSASTEGYADQTATSTDVTIGLSYNLSVGVNVPGGNNYVSAFFDWNQNGDFNDAGETYNIGNRTSNGTIGPYAIAIPATANTGQVRLRIASSNTGYPSSCGIWQYGEVEDYTINVIPNLPSASFTVASLASAAESGTIDITVQLSATSASTVTVPFSISGTATNGSDYTITASPVTIPAGSTTATITIDIIPDTNYEGNEYVVLAMGTPTNAIQGAIISFLATITEDDLAPDSDGDGIRDDVDLDDDNDGIPDIREMLCLPQPFTNGGFELPQVTNTPHPNWQLFDQSAVPGWETTASDGQIEIWDSGFNGVPSYKGLYHAEINANMPARLFQTISVSPGDVLEWEIAHRGRQGNDQMFVYVGPVGAPTLNATVVTGNTAWVVYHGNYLVPAGIYQVELGFEAGYTAGGSASVGNFIDFVSMFIVSNIVCDADNDGIPDRLDLDSDNDGIYDVVEAGGTDANNDGIIDGFTDADGDGLSDNVDDVDNGSGSVSNGTPLLQKDTDGDGNPDYYDTDADGDGCYDTKEAGFTDGDNDGILGSAPVVVDASGKVTSGSNGYTAPNNLDSNSNLDFQEAGSAVTLTTQPIDRTITAGANTTFTVTASAASYQWQVSTNGGVSWSNVTNGGVYSNATTATLTITAAPYSMNGYLCRIFLASPAFACDTDITSNTVRLTVNQAGLTVSGAVFNDTDGTTSPGKVDGSAISSVEGNPLYAVLVNATTNVVIQSTIVSSGVYNFSGSFSGLNLRVLLGITNYSVGVSAPTAGLSSPWSFAGEIQNNAGNTILGNDGTADGIVNLGTINASQAYINFGINLNSAPVANSDAVSQVCHGTINNIDIIANDTDAQGNGTIDVGSIDLDPSTGGQQTSVATAEGTWSVDTGSGLVTFTPGTAEFTTSTINYTVNDTGGSTSNSASITVTFTDAVNPTISYSDALYDDFALVITELSGATSVALEFDNFSDRTSPRDINPTYSDNCAVTLLTYITSGATSNITSPVSGVNLLTNIESFNLGLTTVTWNASDQSGNDATTLQQQVLVIHKNEFTITCPADGNLGCNPSVFAVGTPAYTIPASLQAQIDAGKVTMTPVISSVLNNDESGAGCDKTRTRTYSVLLEFYRGTRLIEDVTLTCNQTYSYTVDTTAPTLTASNQTVDANGAGCIYTISGVGFDPVVTEACGAYTVNYTLTDATTGSGTGSLAGVTLNAGVTTVSWTATDACGNVSSALVRTITVTEIDVAVTNTTSDADDCPDFLTPFNPNTDAYNAGSTLVSFTVTRENSAAAWNFSYELTGGTVNASSPEPNASGSKSVAAGTNTYVFDFYITNTPGAAQTIQLKVTDVWDGNCTHTGTNQAVTHIIWAMPAIGSFN